MTVGFRGFDVEPDAHTVVHIGLAPPFRERRFRGSRVWSGLAIEHMDFEDDLSGVMVPAADGSAIIGVNWNHHPSRRRFTMAHEIGHFVLHSGSTFVDSTYARSRGLNAGSGTKAQERQANQFAAALLMPPKAVRAATASLLLDPAEDAGLNELAEEFAVSSLAMSYRLSNLDLLEL